MSDTEPPLTSKLTEAMPTGLEAPASSQMSLLTVEPFDGTNTLEVGGGTVTVSVAGFVVAVPTTLVNAARNSSPLSERGTTVML